jgi:hypothetical protein
MDRLTHEQAAQLNRALAPHLRFLGKLHARLDAVGFDPTSELYRLVRDAYNAAFTLNVHLHYKSCRGGVGLIGDGAE